jgi:hypothetical protein
VAEAKDQPEPIFLQAVVEVRSGRRAGLLATFVGFISTTSNSVFLRWSPTEGSNLDRRLTSRRSLALNSVRSRTPPLVSTFRTLAVAHPHDPIAIVQKSSAELRG